MPIVDVHDRDSGHSAPQTQPYPHNLGRHTVHIPRLSSRSHYTQTPASPMRSLSLAVVLCAASCAFAQIPTPRPGQLPRTGGQLKLQTKKALGATMPFVAAFSENGGFVLVDPPNSIGKDLPQLALDKIREYQNAGKRIDVFEIAPNGQWILIADDYRFYSSRQYFDEIGLRPKVEEYLAAGKRFDALAFASTGDWVLVAEDYRFYSTGTGFNRMDLRPQLDRLLEAGERIVDIEISPANGFVILTAGDYRGRFIPDPLKRRLDQAKAAGMTFRSLDFNPQEWEERESWLLVTDKRFWGFRLDADVCAAVSDFLSAQGSCTRYTRTPGQEPQPVAKETGRDTKEDRSARYTPPEDELEIVYLDKAPECKSTNVMVAELWKEFERVSLETGCLHPLKNRDRYFQCLAQPAVRLARLGDKMIGYWNSLAKGNWATIGPRRLGLEPEEGTVQSPFQRIFLGAVPVNTEKMSLALTKRSGAARTDVTFCQHFPNGASRVLWKTTIEPDASDGMIWLNEFEDVPTSFLSIKLDADRVVPPKRFAYKIDLEIEPRRSETRPVAGIADLHIHQMAHLAHAGNFFWPEADRSEAEMLNSCYFPDPLLNRPRHAVPRVGDDLVTYHGEGSVTDIDRWPRWDDVTHQQVHEKWLKEAHESGLNLIVASAVNFEPMCQALKLLLPNQHANWGCNDMDNVRRQLQYALDLSERADWYEIAVDPWHARRIIHQGKLAVVLSLEASHLFPAGQAHFSKQLDEFWAMGLRSLQMAHETDTRFAGAAPHRKLFGVFQKFKHPLRNLQGAQSVADVEKKWADMDGFLLDENGKNRIGLRKPGEELLKMMMERHMLVDISHLSETAVRDVFRLARVNNYYPLYNSHTRFDAVLTPEDLAIQREFLSTCEQVRYLERTGGMVGLRTGDNRLKSFHGLADFEGVAVPNSCHGSTYSFAQLAGFGAARTSLGLGLGSDLNGFISQVGPRFGPEACPKGQTSSTGPSPGARPSPGGVGQRLPDASPRLPTAIGPQRNVGQVREASPGRELTGPHEVFNYKGLSHVGLLPSLVEDLEAVGATKTARRIERSAEDFLKMWERAYDPNREAVPSAVSCENWNDLAW